MIIPVPDASPAARRRFRLAAPAAVAGVLLTLACTAAACTPQRRPAPPGDGVRDVPAAAVAPYVDATAEVGLAARTGIDPAQIGADALGTTGQAWEDRGRTTEAYLTDPVGPSTLVTTAAGGTDGGPEAAPSVPLRLVPSVWSEDLTLARSGGGRAGFVDADGDGRADVWVITGAGFALFLARPDGGFAAAPLGALGAAPAPTAVAWGDLDGDGAPELVLARSDPSRRTVLEVWHNDGAGRFSPAAAPPQPRGDVTVRGLALFDCDGDGRRDLVGVRDGAPGFVLRASGPAGAPTFTDATEGSGLDVAQNATGLAVADLDGDGRLDMLSSAAGPASGMRAFFATGGCRFSDRTDAVGLALQATAGAVEGVDVDADGAVDVVATVGPARGANANRMWRNDGNGRFRPVADAGGVTWAPSPAAGVASGLSVGDLDGRGRPDLLVGSSGGPYRLFRNKATAHRVAVRLVGPGAVGAVVTVVDGAGRAHTGLAGAGAATGGGSSATVLIGLGTANAIEAISVRRGPAPPQIVAGAGPADVAITVAADGAATSSALR